MTEIDLIDLIYRAALNDDWQSIASALHMSVDGFVSTHLYGHDLVNNKVTIAATAGYDPDMLASYDQYYHGINKWVPGIAATAIGKVTSSRDYCPDDELLRSEFYNDWIRPQDDIGVGGGIVLFNDARRFVFLGGNFRFKDGDKTENAWTGLLEKVGPHLRNAFELQRMIDGERLVNRGYLDLIDQMENGIILLDAKARVQFRNKVAAQFFTGSKAFHLDGAGGLHVNDAKADETLRAGVAAIACRQHTACQSTFPVRRADGEPPLLAMLSPFAADHDKTGIFADFVNDRLPVAILALHEHAGHGQQAQAMLCSAFDLTPAEAELALALRKGLTLKEHAAQRRVSLHTVRNQLKFIFEKTGTHRQAQLVAMLAGIIG